MVLGCFFALLSQGRVEAKRRVLNMVKAMDEDDHFPESCYQTIAADGLSEKFSEGDASFFFQNSAYKATDGESHRVVRRNYHPYHQDYGKRKYHQNP